MSARLYAKSFDKQKGAEENILLHSHLKYSMWAAEAILKYTELFQLKGLGIDQSQLERFRRLVLLAAAIHDLGKANSLFQSAVRSHNVNQSIRHEWILFLLLRFSPLGNWIRSGLQSDDDLTILIWAIAGHHRKGESDITMESGKGMEILFSNEDFQNCLNWVTEEFHLDSPPQLDPKFIEDEAQRKILEELLSDLGEPGRTIACMLDERSYFEQDRDIAKDRHHWKPGDRALMSAVRSTLMAADVVASALADPDFNTEGEVLTRDQIHDWVEAFLGQLPLPHQYDKIVEHRRHEIALKSTSGPKNATLEFERNAFQDQVADSKTRVTLVAAGCGSGKTLAAFRWAQNRALANGNRLFFGYPTTGTATEGFLDYLLDNKEKFGDLIHSRVKVDFFLNERMRNAASNDSDDRAEIVKSLRLWSCGIACCTIDTMLGFLVNMYSGLLSWPVFAQSFFIFDEIHSYDETLFNYLLKFLRLAKGMPILLMTASLPKKRLQQLRDVIAEQNEELGIVHGPDEWERIIRYQRFLPQLNTEDAAIDEAIARYNQGEKVLWICNTVGRAIKIAKKIKERTGQYHPIVYHSHFRYEDRVKRHKECVDAFRNDGGVICITTQVAEMSLDLSADFLFMDIAPIPAMIQRLGRLNRYAIFNGAEPFWILFPEDKGQPLFLPYSTNTASRSGDGVKSLPDWYNESLRWLEILDNKALSQTDLTESWLSMADENYVEPDNDCPPWSAMGPFMNHGNLREVSSGCEVILQSDLEAIKQGGTFEYLRCVLPMSQPPCKKIKLDKHPKYGCYIVNDNTQIDYSSELGGQWKTNEQSPDGIKGFEIY